MMVKLGAALHTIKDPASPSILEVVNDIPADDRDAISDLVDDVESDGVRLMTDSNPRVEFLSRGSYLRFMRS